MTSCPLLLAKPAKLRQHTQWSLFRSVIARMQASRVRLSSSSATRGFLIPPRTSFDILKSAASASWKILWSQEKRDEFVETLNKGIIRPEILSQADHGPAMVLALFHDLESPLFKQYKRFDAGEFSEGVKDALVQFHNVQGNLENTLYDDDNDATAPPKDEKQPITKEKDTEGSKENDETTSSSQEDTVVQFLDAFGPSTNKAEVAQLLQLKDKTKEIQQLLRRNWVKEAESKPESLSAQLMAMVTPQYFHAIQDFARTKWLVGDKWLYQDGSSEINNVALLSARAQLVGEDSEASEEASGSTEDDDDKDKEHFSQGARIAAQVEVLYDIKQTFTLVANPDQTSSKEGDAEQTSNEDEDKENTDETTVTKPNVWVGVFEGWLNGNPDGTSDLRWKLVLNRQAWEFPSLNSSYYQ